MFQDFRRFVSFLFLIFEKEGKQKISLGCFKICKYTFFIFEKVASKKIVLGIFKICECTLFKI